MRTGNKRSLRIIGALALLTGAAGGGYAWAQTQTAQPQMVVACQSNKMLMLADPTTGQCPPGQTRVELTTTAYQGFLGRDEKAADADKLDGFDSSAFWRGAVLSMDRAQHAQRAPLQFAVLETTGSGFKLCQLANVGAPSFSFVAYVNGTRASGTLSSTNPCYEFDPGNGGDFEVVTQGGRFFASPETRVGVYRVATVLM